MNNFLPNNPRMYLWVALGLLAIMNYQTWMHDYAPAPGAVTAGATGPSAATAVDGASLGDRADHSGPGASTPAASTSASVAPAAPATDAAAGAEASAPAPVVHVRTDVLDLQISTRGGTLTRADLLAYPQVKGGEARVRLENDDSPASQYLLQSGIAGVGDAANYPGGGALYSAPRLTTPSKALMCACR